MLEELHAMQAELLQAIADERGPQRDMLASILNQVITLLIVKEGG